MASEWVCNGQTARVIGSTLEERPVTVEAHKTKHGIWVSCCYPLHKGPSTHVMRTLRFYIA